VVDADGRAPAGRSAARAGRAGNDVVYARNGRRDRINCGGGRRDRVYADRRDRLSGCETRIY